MRLLLTLSALIACPPWARALDPRRALTQYQKASWGPESGLPCHDILAVAQASDGYIWLGTEEGLVRFDGVRARVFDRLTDPVLEGNNISSVFEDARRPGQLLLGSANGITRWVNGRVEASSGVTPARQPSRIILQEPGDGALWVKNRSGLFHVAPDGQVSGPAEAASGWPAETVRTVCRDGAGRLWVGTAQGLYRQHDSPAGEGMRFDLLPGWSGQAIDCLTPARAGGLWVGSRSAGTGRLDEGGAFHPRGKLAGCAVTALLEDRAGMLWVGTYGNGLFRLPDGEAASTGLRAEVLTEDKGLVSNEVRDLCEDQEGNLWVATVKGLQVLRDVRFVNFGRPEGLAGEQVRTVWEDHRGRLWIGHESGLSALNPSGGQVDNYPLPPSPRRPDDGRVLCVGAGEETDTLLAGTHAGLVRWREGKLELLPIRDDLDGTAVRALCLDDAGNQWVGTESGLYQVRGNQVLAHVTTSGGLADNGVLALYADQRGNLWIGTNGGLSRRGPDGQVTNFLNFGAGQAAPSVHSFCADPTLEGDLFVATDRGLHRLHAMIDGEVRIMSYSTRDGLFDDMLWSVLGDGRGNLWMSSNKGIFRVALADLARFDRGEIARLPGTAYGVTDGLRSRETNGGAQPAACRDHAGRLWYATIRGAACVDPARVAPNLRPPPVQFEELLADGRGVPSPAGVAGAEGPVPRLDPGTQKLDFRYTALSLTAPETNRFRYRLEPFESEWTDAKTERVAHYTNLPPGDYRFRVQGANADGVWNEADAALAFYLRPFWYQTLWFRALVVGAGLAALWFGQHGLRRRWQRRLARAEAELRERARNQEVLHHAKEEAEEARVEAEKARARAEHSHAEAETVRVEAERANAAKSEFLSRVSHELRTPLNAILGFGQLLQLDALPRRQQESVEHILGGGRHLLGLIDEILDLARIERGEEAVQPEALGLEALLGEVAGLVQPLARGRGVNLRVEVADVAGSRGAWVMADPRRLRQVLLNLFSNAVKYNRPVGGEVVAGISPAAATPGDGIPLWRISVRDNGAGMSAGDLAKLFTPFERLGAAYGPIEGTGLGLAVSRQLVGAMGGALGVESTPGVGSTFWVELPALAAALMSLPSAPMPGEALATRFPPETWVPTAGPEDQGGVLYIEDNDSNRRLLECVVAQHRPDLRLRCAVNGRAGLLLARTEPWPDLILLDLQLPGLPGEEVLARLRADPVTRALPVVVLSADATTARRAHLSAAGATAYLTKPLEVPQLLEVLASHCPSRANRPS